MARSTNTRFAVAVHVLTLLAGVNDGRVVSSEELADSAGVNPVHVRRVLGPLREAGLVRSHAGARGGWELACRPEGISLGTVWRLLQGDDHVLGLHGPNPSCVTGEGVQRALTVLDAAIADALVAQLERFSVRDVLDGKITAQFAQAAR
ncbi:Rrf2 family transcriptional regulator [Saccharothrix coeruleofusca]|uniref:Transcriptional regulator n=1 Tax=Saccharothrix coeruleofusca TaxID=33919 RepID=A0A918ATG0_9PSEU|nr:Rrf2 family transcriptional regulator [Saccharothrix coeruleofusca]MBP2334828.1 Rrf2 family protein [Saccharothrix coeruleofusca]GGP73889.1 transcriptional regulator [Saccharothrix coeruleofusca]